MFDKNISFKDRCDNRQNGFGTESRRKEETNEVPIKPSFHDGAREKNLK